MSVFTRYLDVRAGVVTLASLRSYLEAHRDTAQRLATHFEDEAEAAEPNSTRAMGCHSNARSFRDEVYLLEGLIDEVAEVEEAS